MYRESLLYTAKIEGEKKGVKKGIKQGIKEGEKKAKIEIVKSLLLAKVDIDTIVKSTGLSIGEIEELREK